MDRINTQVISRFESAKVGCTGYVLLNDCKQKIMSLSLLVGTTVIVNLSLKIAFSSPEHELLKVSYWNQSISAIWFSFTNGPVLIKLHRNVFWMPI